MYLIDKQNKHVMKQVMCSKRSRESRHLAIVEQHGRLPAQLGRAAPRGNAGLRDCESDGAAAEGCFGKVGQWGGRGGSFGWFGWRSWLVMMLFWVVFRLAPVLQQVGSM